MKRKFFSLFLAANVFAAIVPVDAQSTTSTKGKGSSGKAQSSKSGSTSSTAIAASANGWTYVNRQWMHPDGYKFVDGQVLRTTAKPGHLAPKPPGKLAVENAPKLAAQNTPSPAAVNAAKAAAQKAAAEKNKPWVRPASQTGSHL